MFNKSRQKNKVFKNDVNDALVMLRRVLKSENQQNTKNFYVTGFKYNVITKTTSLLKLEESDLQAGEYTRDGNLVFLDANTLVQIFQSISDEKTGFQTDLAYDIISNQFNDFLNILKSHNLVNA